jgi:hypothetical protein
MRQKHAGGRPPSKHPKLVAVAFKCSEEVTDALEAIREHMNKNATIGVMEANKSDAFRYAILTTAQSLKVVR